MFVDYKVEDDVRINPSIVAGFSDIIHLQGIAIALLLCAIVLVVRVEGSKQKEYPKKKTGCKFS
jgi:hypothetical protein